MQRLQDRQDKYKSVLLLTIGENTIIWFGLEKQFAGNLALKNRPISVLYYKKKGSHHKKSKKERKKRDQENPGSAWEKRKGENNLKFWRRTARRGMIHGN